MQSIGERLEEARKRKGISIREAAEATKIRGDYLHKFESNQYDLKLPEIYVRGFLRTYANFLKLPGDKILNDYSALGITESRPRQLNRELYGRMDLTVSNAKAEKGGKERPDGAPVSNEPASAEAKSLNPATFVPPSSGTSIDKSMLWRLGGMLALFVAVIGVIAWLVFGRSSTPPTVTQRPVSTPAAPSETWQRPQPGEAVITLVAKNAAVSVTVTLSKDGTPLFQGSIPAGDSRAIAWRGALKVTAEPFTNLEFEIGGKRYPMPNQRTAEIKAPSN